MDFSAVGQLFSTRSCGRLRAASPNSPDSSSSSRQAILAAGPHRKPQSQMKRRRHHLHEASRDPRFLWRIVLAILLTSLILARIVGHFGAPE